jgi:hypothetical protein
VIWVPLKLGGSWAQWQHLRWTCELVTIYLRTVMTGSSQVISDRCHGWVPGRELAGFVPTLFCDFILSGGRPVPACPIEVASGFQA